MGRTVSAETKQKISRALLGKTVSDDTKVKMAEAKAGKTLPEKTKEAMSRAQLKRQQLSNEISNLAKLTPELIKEIKEEWDTRQFSTKQLGAKYGVHRTTIWRIVNDKSWKKFS